MEEGKRVVIVLPGGLHGGLDEVGQEVEVALEAEVGDVLVADVVAEPVGAILQLLGVARDEACGGLEQLVEPFEVGVGEAAAERLDDGDNRFGVLLEDGELGVEAADAASQARHVGETGVVAVGVEDDDRVVLGRQLLDDAAGSPALAGAGHGEDGQVAGDDGVAVDQDVDVGAVGEGADVEGAAGSLAEVADDDPADVGGGGLEGGGGGLGRVAEVVELAAEAVAAPLGAEDLADRGHHLPAEGKDRVEGVGPGGGELVAGLGGEEGVDPLNPLHLGPDADRLRGAGGGIAEEGVDGDDVLLADRLVGDGDPKLAAGALAHERADVLVLGQVEGGGLGHGRVAP